MNRWKEVFESGLTWDEFFENAIQNRRAFLAPYKVEYDQAEDERRAEIVIELCRIEPTHKDEEWIAAELTSWMRLPEGTERLKRALIQPGYYRPTEKQMIKKARDWSNALRLQGGSTTAKQIAEQNLTHLEKREACIQELAELKRRHRKLTDRMQLPDSCEKEFAERERAITEEIKLHKQGLLRYPYTNAKSVTNEIKELLKWIEQQDEERTLPFPYYGLDCGIDAEGRFVVLSHCGPGPVIKTEAFPHGIICWGKTIYRPPIGPTPKNI